MRGKWFNLILAGLMVGTLALAGCGDDGKRGAAGDEGMSAYEIAVENGFVGTESEWLESLQGGTNLVSPQEAETNQCITCHTSFDAAALAVAPFGDEVTERFLTSRHANQRARTGNCSACHSHEGGKELLKMGRFTSDADLKAAYNADTVDAYSLPVGSDTIVGVNKKTCSTCHTTSHFPNPPGPGLRGDGDVLAKDISGLLPAGATTFEETTVVYSAEFNLCTACHMVDINPTYREKGNNGLAIVDYALSDAYLAENQISAETGTYDTSKRVFYHDGASGSSRTMIDTHFGGEILSHFVDFEAGDDNITIKGYNINAGAANACTTCHDPHTGSKLIAKEDGEFPSPNGESADNAAIGYAQGLGDFHNSYQTTAAYRVSGCTPCHTGDTFASYTTAGVTDYMDSSWNTLGCRGCHDLAQSNASAGDNNHAAFAKVREFPDTFEFAFNSGEVVTDDLGNNQICFECHKGRTPYKGDTITTTDEDGVETIEPITTAYNFAYLHYAPSFAILYGDESKMVPTYEDKAYAGRFVHPVANAAGSYEFGCIDCHDVHNTNNNNAAENKMTTSASCTGCHSVGGLTPANLKTRTEAYSVRLFDTILVELENIVASDNDAAIIVQGIDGDNVGLTDAEYASFETLFGENYATAITDVAIYKRLKTYATGSGRDVTGSRFATNALAKAASIWKIFTYDDGAPVGHDGVEGHGGSWAHNSLFARQVMFDAIQALDGDTTGLGRPN